MIRPSRPRTIGRTSRGTSAVAIPMSKVTGRSRITTCFSVRAKSCIIGLPWTWMSMLRRTRPGGVEHRVVDAVAAHPAVGEGVQLAGLRVLVRMRGVARASRGGGAGAAEVVRTDGVEVVCQLVRRRRRPRRARACARRARARWCWPRSRSRSGVPRTGSPSSARRRRTSAPSGCGTTAPFPSRRRTPCTIPSPRNQW